MPPEGTFEPSTGNLDGVGVPPDTIETAVQPLSDETRATFHARAEEAAIRADVRTHLMDILSGLGDVAARKLMGM